jgi:hypothetical protein
MNLTFNKSFQIQTLHHLARLKSWALHQSSNEKNHQERLLGNLLKGTRKDPTQQQF